MLLWVLGVWGCARSPAEDVTAYTALVAQKAPDPGRDFSACRKIGDENLAGDCALVVAERVAMVRQQPPDTWCGQVPSGIWREECWFQAAEQERRGGRESVAAKLCVKAGPFQNDCAQHLWQTKVYRVIHGQPGQRPDFAGNMAAALAIYNEWAPYLTDTSDLETRFWEKFFQNGFEGAGEVNLAWCDDLSAADKTRCHAAARELVIREMAPNLDHNNADRKSVV